MNWFLGIDAGSTYVKAVLIDETGFVKGRRVSATGFNAEDVASRLVEEICGEACIASCDICGIVATGYGRRRIGDAGNNVTEIKAHAMGALRNGDAENGRIRTIIDVGGQDLKVIILGDAGEIESFVMNDSISNSIVH